MKLKASCRPPSRKTSVSGWPAVVRKAVRAVRLVTIALIACVVPCTRISPRARYSASGTPETRAAAPMTSSTPATGSAGCVGALNIEISPLSSATMRSVNVPPVSTAKRSRPLPALICAARDNGELSGSREDAGRSREFIRLGSHALEAWFLRERHIFRRLPTTGAPYGALRGYGSLASPCRALSRTPRPKPPAE